MALASRASDMPNTGPMTDSERAIIERARGIIGTNPVRNRSLGAGADGLGHINRIKQSIETEPFISILRSKSVQDAYRRYADRDAAAGTAQRRYKFQQHLLFWPIVIALAAGLLNFILPVNDMANGYVRQFAHRGLDQATVSKGLQEAGFIACAGWLLLSAVYLRASVISRRPAAENRLATFREWFAERTANAAYWPAALLLCAGLLCTAHYHWLFAAITVLTSLGLLATRWSQSRTRDNSQRTDPFNVFLKGTDQLINRETYRIGGLLLVVALFSAASFWIYTPGRYALFAKTLQPEDVELAIRVNASRVVFLSLFVAAMLSLLSLVSVILRPAHDYQTWNEARGTAEAMRRELFERIVDAPLEKKDGELPRLTLILEYFRRYQIELQQAYFATRGQEHEWSAQVARVLECSVVAGLIVWCLADLSTAWSGTSEQGAAGWPRAGTQHWMWASGQLQHVETTMSDFWMLGLSVGLALIAAGAKLHATLNASVRNAARYKNMRDKFKMLTDDIDTVRAAAVRGDETAVRAYMKRVHSIMSIELNDWVQIAELEAGRQPRDPASAATS